MSLRGAEPLFCCVFLPFSKVGNSQRHGTRLDYSGFYGGTRFNYSSFYGSPSLVGELDNCAIKLRQKHFTKVWDRGRSGDRTAIGRKKWQNDETASGALIGAFGMLGPIENPCFESLISIFSDFFYRQLQMWRKGTTSMLRLQVESETDPGMTRGKKRKKKGWYRINLNKEWCAMKSRIPYLGEGTENIDKKGEKKQKNTRSY